MQKKYIFTLDKYYNDEEIANVSPIIENFVNIFADDNGVAVLKLKDDVSVVVKKDEGLVLHMILDDAERFTALPKKLARPKDFLAKFITAMAKEVDAHAKQTQTIDVASAKAKVEADAENSLFDYIGGDAPATTDDAEPKTTVKGNGEEITDPAEKQKVIDELESKRKEIQERASKIFNDTFDKILKSLASTDVDWLKKYLG